MDTSPPPPLANLWHAYNSPMNRAYTHNTKKLTQFSHSSLRMLVLHSLSLNEPKPEEGRSKK